MQYKEKLRLANNLIKTLSSKVANNYDSAPHEMIRVGGINLERDGTHQSSSNRASDADIKDAIHKVMQDENLKIEMKKLLT